MAQLPQEQKAKIAEQVASFQEEKSKLDAEVSKWDDSGNDIIVLAKQMCMIMMEMTDFTRWVYSGILSSFSPFCLHSKPWQPLADTQKVLCLAQVYIYISHIQLL